MLFSSSKLFFSLNMFTTPYIKHLPSPSKTKPDTSNEKQDSNTPKNVLFRSGFQTLWTVTEIERHPYPATGENHHDLYVSTCACFPRSCSITPQCTACLFFCPHYGDKKQSRRSRKHLENMNFLSREIAIKFAVIWSGTGQHIYARIKTFHSFSLNLSGCSYPRLAYNKQMAKLINLLTWQMLTLNVQKSMKQTISKQPHLRHACTIKNAEVSFQQWTVDDDDDVTNCWKDHIQQYAQMIVFKVLLLRLWWRTEFFSIFLYIILYSGTWDIWRFLKLLELLSYLLFALIQTLLITGHTQLFSG